MLHDMYKLLKILRNKVQMDRELSNYDDIRALPRVKAK